MMGLSTALEITARIELGTPQIVGPTPDGLRRMIPIVGGTFEGLRLRGTIAGGADWQYQRPDGATIVNARYLLRTDDQALIQIDNSGIRQGPPEVIQRLSGSEVVNPKEYYFRTRPEFQAPLGRYDWLNLHVFVATAARYASSVSLEIYRVL